MCFMWKKSETLLQLFESSAGGPIPNTVNDGFLDDVVLYMGHTTCY